MSREPDNDPTTWWVFDPGVGESLYVRQVLEAYATTPTTAGRVRREDRRLAGRLYRQRVPLSAVLAALTLAAGRRIFRDFDAMPLAPIRSLHYFLPVVDEILSTPIDPGYIDCTAYKVQNADAFLEQYRQLLGRSCG
jgi:hypothetical protein